MSHSTQNEKQTGQEAQNARMTRTPERTPERIKWLMERRDQQAATVNRRREFVAPLFTYCEEHALVASVVARRAAHRAGWDMTNARVAHIKRGRGIIPDWFIPGICREIGQPVEVVMGSEWAQRHLPQPEHEPGQKDTDRKAS